MNSIQDTREAAGRERAANVHLAFNNFAADESIPIVKQLGKLQQDVSAGIAAAAPVFDQISTFALELKSTSAFKDVLGTPSANQAFSFLEDLSRVGKTAAANMGAELLDEFSPSPSDTMRILTGVIHVYAHTHVYSHHVYLYIYIYIYIYICICIYIHIYV